MSRKLALISLSILVLHGCGGEGQDPVPEGALATASLSYRLAGDNTPVSSQLAVQGPQIDLSIPSAWTQDSVRESAALVNFIEGLKQATDAYFAPLIEHCKDEVAKMQIVCDADVAQELNLSCSEYVAQREEHERLICLGSAEQTPDSVAGSAAMAAVKAFLRQEAAALAAGALEKEISLAAEIEANMLAGGDAPPYDPYSGGVGAPSARMEGDAAAGGGTLGATPGGAQDIGYLRTVVEEGFVPLPSHLAAEGLFSEHHLPIEESAPCSQLLCVRAATGYAPVLGQGNTPSYFVQVGFSSNLRADTFQRAPLNLAVVLDVSGSMGGQADETMSKMEAVKAALTKMVDRLDENDRLAIVLFNSQAWVLQPSTPVTDKAALKATIATISEGGGTNIENGLQKGFELVAAHSDQSVRMDRVMLLTDALPNVGRTGQGSFLDLAERYADQNIGLSTFGAGVNFGQELVVELSRVRGGNYFFLEDADRIAEVFELDFDYLVTPLAYDLKLRFTPAAGLATVGVFGIPTWEKGQNVVQMDVRTLFLSRKHGAIVIQLQPQTVVAQ